MSLPVAMPGPRWTESLTAIRRHWQASRYYRFSTQWRLQAAPGEIADVFLDAATLPNWWPHLVDVDVVEPGDRNARGRQVRMTTKSFLPYSLRVDLEATHTRYPDYFVLRFRGDLVGSASGQLVEVAGQVQVRFTLRVQVQKPLLARWSFLLRPLFVANHRWLMLRGQKKMRRELLRRRKLRTGARRRAGDEGSPSGTC